MKRPNIKCQYCGSRAFLRPASVLNKSEHGNERFMFYVCARYPACDAYVTAHSRTLMPMGALANRQLRQKRRAAHAVFNQLWLSGRMSKKEAYHWLRDQLGIASEDAHIAKFMDYRCDETIRLCESFMDKSRTSKNRATNRDVKGGNTNERADY